MTTRLACAMLCVIVGFVLFELSLMGSCYTSCVDSLSPARLLEVEGLTWLKMLTGLTPRWCSCLHSYAKKCCLHSTVFILFSISGVLQFSCGKAPSASQRHVLVLAAVPPSRVVELQSSCGVFPLGGGRMSRMTFPEKKMIFGGRHFRFLETDFASASDTVFF